jgi:hypothetical protein
LAPPAVAPQLRRTTLAELAANIRAHPDNRATMDAATLTQQVETWNHYCAAQHDPDFDAEPSTAERRCGSTAGDGVKPSLRSRPHG